MGKHISISVCIMLFLLLYIVPVSANVSAEFYAGLSGTSFTEAFIEAALEDEDDEDDNIAEEAEENGALTGEVGVSLDMSLKPLGLRFQGILGYYKYRAFEEDSAAYSIYMAGVEPYISFDGMNFGIGYGRFFGTLWQKYNEIEISSEKEHKGYAIWGTIGGVVKDVYHLSLTIRYHRFTYFNEEAAGGDDEFTRDYVAVFKFGLKLELFR